MTKKKETKKLNKNFEYKNQILIFKNPIYHYKYIFNKINKKFLIGQKNIIKLKKIFKIKFQILQKRISFFHFKSSY